MGIGISVKRQDAIDKVTGRAKYVDDCLPGDALVGKILHSTIANGRVTSINIDRARNMPGVEDIITCFDVPTNQYATAGHPFSLDPDHKDVKNRTILTSRVRYYGDDIAAVVADNGLNAQKALDAIEVKYEEYAPHLNPRASVVSKHVLHDQFPENKVARMDFEIKDSGDVDFYQGDFSEDPNIGGHDDLKGDHFYVPIQQHCHIENISCFAYMSNGKMIVVSPNQAPFTLRRNVAEAIGMPIGDVRVIKPVVGGGFGNKQDTYYEPLAALLSIRMGGRCVSFSLSREETFVNSRTRHAMDIWSATTVDQGGAITKKGIRLNAYSGAYGSNSHAVAAYAVTNFFQLYPGAKLQVGESSTTYNTLPSAAAMRGYGIPQVDFAMESQMDDKAKELGMDPIEFRKKNMMKLNAKDPFDAFICKSNGLEECLDKGMKLMDWLKKRTEYDEFNKNSKNLKKGIGVAIFAYKTGVYPIQLETASSRIVMNEDGSMQLQVGATELGQGSDTVFAQIASQILSVPESKIRVITSQDTDVTPHDAGAYASRQSYVSGSAVKQTAQQLRIKILDRAAQVLKRSSEELELKTEQIIDKLSESTLMSLADLAVQMQYANRTDIDSEHLSAESTFTIRSSAFAFGASFVDIDVDVPIGKIKINRIIALHDSGTILNPQLAAGQVHGGVAMGLGYALSEQMLFDQKTGKPLNNNLLDYKIPTAMDIPDIETVFVETYEPSGPFGNKALAEPPTIPQAPALRNALLHATGIGINSLPLNPQRLVHEFIKAGLIQE